MNENNSFGALLDVIPFATYAVDVETYQVVYINKMLKERIYAPKEEFCWKKIYGQNEICSWCTIFKLTYDKKLQVLFLMNHRTLGCKLMMNLLLGQMAKLLNVQ